MYAAAFTIHSPVHIHHTPSLTTRKKEGGRGEIQYPMTGHTSEVQTAAKPVERREGTVV